MLFQMGTNWKLTCRDSTEEAESPVKKLLWESRHGMSVSCSRKGGSSDNGEKWSNSRCIRKADPAVLVNDLGVE